MVGLGGLEPPTSPLSGVRSNHLSYKPLLKVLNDLWKLSRKEQQLTKSTKIELFLLKGGDPTAGSPTVTLLRLHPSRCIRRGR